MGEEPQKFSDAQRATLFLYALQIGLPPWADGDVAAVLAVVADWPRERAVKAFAAATQDGFMEFEEGRWN